MKELKGLGNKKWQLKGKHKGSKGIQNWKDVTRKQMIDNDREGENEGIERNSKLKGVSQEKNHNWREKIRRDKEGRN